MKAAITFSFKKFFFLFLVIGIFLLSQGLNAQVTLNGAATTSQTGAGVDAFSLTWSHTVAAGANKLLVVTCSYDDDAETVTSVAFGAASLTRLSSQDGGAGSSIRTEIWYLINPTASTANIVWTHPDDEGLIGCAITFNGVNQTTPFGTVVKSGSTGSSSTLTLSAADGDMLIDVIANNTSAITVGAGQTERKNASANGFADGGTSTFLEQCPGTAPTMSWTFAGSSDYSHIAVPIKAITTITPITMSTSAASTDQNVCGATTATLAGNAAGAGETGLWTLTAGTATITSNTSPTSGITALSTSATLRWNLIHTATGCKTTDDVVITQGSITASAAGTDQNICNNATTATLAGNAVAGHTGVWTLIGGSGTITSSTTANSGLTALGAGANTFRWTLTNTICTSNGSTTDDVIINRYAAPTTSAAGVDQSVCATATLAGNAPVTGTGVWSRVSGTGTITSPSSPTSGLTGLGGGANTFRWTITNGTCTSTDDVIITSTALPLTLAAYASSNCPVSTTVSILTLDPLDFTSYTSMKWQKNDNGAGYVDIAGATTPTYSFPLVAGHTYTYQALVTNACGTNTIVATAVKSAYSMFDYAGTNEDYATASAAGNCYDGLVASRRYCFSFIYDDDIEFDFNSDCADCMSIYNKFSEGSSSSSISSGGSSCSSLSSSASGDCSTTTTSGCTNCGFSMYDANCGVVKSDGLKWGSSCSAPAMVEGNVYYICVTVPSTCSPASFCPRIKCLTTNCAASPLPIELLYFNAMAVNDQVQLKWVTSTETNNDYFTVEKSSNGKSFEEVVKVSGGGNSSSILNYNTIDENPLKGISYYRLKQTDYDGKFAYSKIVSVEMASSNPLKLIYVSPDQNKNSLQYQFSYTQNKPLSVEVIDIVGQTVYSQKVSSDDNGQVLSMDATSLSKGVYLMKISDGIYSEVKKFVY